MDPGTERWQEVGELLSKHMEPQNWMFYNTMIMLGLCGAGKADQAAIFLDKLNQFSKR